MRAGEKFMRKVVVLGMVVAGILTSASVADATVRTVATVYYCSAKGCAATQAALEPPTGPTFNPTPPPTITTYPVSVTFDPAAGVLTYSEGTPTSTYPFLGPGACDAFPPPADPCASDTGTNDLQVASHWANLGVFQLEDGSYTPGAYNARVVTFGYGVTDPYGPATDWSTVGQQVPDPNEITPSLTETGVRGSLTPTEALNGNAFTYTWSSPYLKGLNLTEINTMTSGGPGLVNNLLGQLGIGPLYFAGFHPAPPPPKVPLDDFLNNRDEGVKPASITTTGDGSAFFGGRTGHEVTGGPNRRANFGHLHWTVYNQNEADATGVDWAKFGPGPLSIDAFHVIGTVKLHFYHLVNGVFTKVAIREHFNRNARPFIHGTHTYHYNYEN